MVVEAQRLAVESVARAAAEVAASSDLRTALGAIARAAATATGADLSVVRVADAEGVLVARAQAPEGSALAAEVAGTRASCEQLGAGAVPEPTLRAARRAHAAGILALPARAAGRIVGSIELVRIAEDFDDEERAIADLIAAQVALAFRTIGPDPGATGIRARASRPRDVRHDAGARSTAVRGAAALLHRGRGAGGG